jgi:hypothetical protein
MPLPIGALAAASAIPGLVNAGVGIYQLSQAKKYLETDRPTYTRPEEIKQATELARRESELSTLPGEAVFRNRLAGSTASGVSALKNTADSPVDIASGVTKLVQSEQKQLTDLQIQAEQNRKEAVSRLQGALGVEAGYSDREFEVNQWEPYMNAMRAAAALQSAGSTNLAGGLQSAGTSALSAGIQAYGYNQQEKIQTPWQQWLMTQGATK